VFIIVSESAFTFLWNHCSPWIGIGVHDGSEYAARDQIPPCGPKLVPSAMEELCLGYRAALDQREVVAHVGVRELHHETVVEDVPVGPLVALGHPRLPPTRAQVGPVDPNLPVGGFNRPQVGGVPRVPDLLGGVEGQGLKQMFTGLDVERFMWSGLAIGIAQAAFEAALKYAKEREQFGQPIFNFQMIQDKLVTMSVEIEAARLLAAGRKQELVGVIAQFADKLARFVAAGKPVLIKNIARSPWGTSPAPAL
jgi:hypothetical protein